MERYDNRKYCRNERHGSPHPESEKNSENPFHLLMNPRSIAVVGAGNNPMKMGTMQALSIIKDGFTGTVYPIHPREENVLGYKAYTSVFDLPEPPDLAMLVVPTKSAVELLEQLGQIGTKRAIIISAGFKETGQEGEALEERLREVGARFGIRFLGPNCMGILNSQASLNMTVMRMSGKPGMLGIASQSGTYVTQTLAYLRKRGIFFSKAISVGNEADLNLVDALEYLGEDESTRAIGLYIEGIRDGRRFIEVAQSITPHKPVLAQYVGGSDAGARAGSSHTGSMAGPDYLYDGIFKQAGIIRVHSIEDLYGHGWALATQPPLRGPRVGVITNSGGPGTAISHTCDEGGMEVPLLSKGLQEEMEALLPGQASSKNPVDVTFNLDATLISTTLPEMLMKSGEVDGIVLHGAMSSSFMEEKYPHIKELIGNAPLEDLLERFKRDMTEPVSLPWKHNIPLIISSFREEDNFSQAYYQNHVPVFDSPEKAAKAMLALNRYRMVKQRKNGIKPDMPARSARAEDIIRTAAAKGQRHLDEYASKQVLALYGIPTVEEKLTNSAAEAVDAAEQIGLPVALKGCSPHVLHKTEKGLVFLNLTSADQVQEAADKITLSSGEKIPLLVSKMVKGDRELIAGMTRFPGFGPCVLFGIGGIFTEVLKEITFRSAPLSLEEAEEMLYDTKAGNLLKGFRGMPPVDQNALLEILQRLSFIGILHPEIAEIDINPLILGGSKPVAVDALMVL